LSGKERRGPKLRKSAVVPTKSIVRAANVPIIGGHHVLALQGSPEGWQATPLLECCREQADRPGRVVQRHVPYLGEINDTQELAWRRSIEVHEEGAAQPRTLSLFPEERRRAPGSEATISSKNSGSK
jgi:hypothetical protein